MSLTNAAGLLVDVDQLVDVLMKADVAAAIATAGLTEATIEADVDFLEKTQLVLPLITYHVDLIGRDGNGPGLWTATLNLSVQANGRDTTFDYAQAADAAIWGWDIPTAGIVTDVGSIEAVDDDTAPTQAASATSGGINAVLYTGAYTLTIRSQ